MLKIRVFQTSGAGLRIKMMEISLKCDHLITQVFDGFNTHTVGPWLPEIYIEVNS